MEPAKRIILLFGGPSEVARFLGVHRTRVSNWMRPKDKGGSGGRVPQNHHLALLAEAERRGVPLSADDLLPMAQLSEEAA